VGRGIEGPVGLLPIPVPIVIVDPSTLAFAGFRRGFTSGCSFGRSGENGHGILEFLGLDMRPVGEGILGILLAGVADFLKSGIDRLSTAEGPPQGHRVRVLRPHLQCTAPHRPPQLIIAAETDAAGMRGRVFLVPLVLLALLCMSWAPSLSNLTEVPSREESPSDGIHDVLLMGNSYTSANSLRDRVQSVFDDAGHPAAISDLTGGGMKLVEHADNAETPGHQWHTRLTTNDFDYVVLQDQSQVPSFPPESSTNWQDSKDGAIRLDSMIEDADAETVFFQTWGYRDGDSTNAVRNPDYPTMQANLESGYRLYAENLTDAERTAYIAPVGLAFQVIYDDIVAAGGTPTDSGSLFYTLYSSDGAHPSARGSYLAACVIHATLAGTSSVGLPDDVGLNSNTRMQLQQAADAAVFNNTPTYVYPWQSPGGGVGGSNLWFGSNDGSNFRIAPGISTGIAVNITNNASFADTALIRIISNSDWEMSWSNGDGNPANAMVLPMESDSLHWVQFSISVPLVEMGLPLAGSRHGFTVEAVSQDDGDVDTWSFTIEVMAWHGAEIVAEPIDDTVDPDLKVRVPVTVRNLGNEAASLAVRIRPVTEAGVPIPGQQAAISFQEGGWSVGIFELYNVNDLGAYSSGTVQLEFDAPDDPSGTMWVEFTTWSSRANQQVYSVILEVSILRERNAVLDLVSGCDEILPGGHCDATIWIQNTGNYHDSYELSATETAGLTISLEESQFDLNPWDSSQITVVFELDEGLQAGVEFNPMFTLETADGIGMALALTEIEVDTMISWKIESNGESVDDLDNITVAYTLVNTGNADDGLDVTLSTNVWTEFGLIPPFTSDWESDDGTPNHFILHDIPPGTEFTFRAWVELPRDQKMNGTAEITVEMRSTLEPGILFTNRTTHDYLAEQWRPENIVEPSGLEKFVENLAAFWVAWNQVLISLIVIAIGSMLLLRAVEHRARKDAEWAALHAHVNVEPEKVEDWMEKFENGGEKPPESIESPSMPADAFTTGFQMKATPKSKRVAPDDSIVDAAQSVLEHHDSKADYAAIDDLVGDLLDEKKESSKNDLDLDL